MNVTMHRCPDCGGGPVKPLAWRKRGAAGMERVKTHCANCGHVQSVEKSERHW